MTTDEDPATSSLTSIRDVLRRHSRPLAPLPTDASPRLEPRGDIRAVFFDVYGTMFVSGSGDVGTTVDRGAVAFHNALAAVGLKAQVEGPQVLGLIDELIHRSHEESRAQGVDYPEVDIVEIARQVIETLHRRGAVSGGADDVDLRRLAVEYEARVNPVWPMPGVVETIGWVRASGRAMGIVSNAQFFTPELFPALLDRTAEELGFAPELTFYSYRFGRAKPGEWMFRLAAEELEGRGLRTGQALYVGNCMLNDIMPAARLGFRTALFAGDARSWRRREGDPRVEGVEPDLVLTHWDQLRDCL